MKTCVIFMRQILGLRFLNYLDDFPFGYPTVSEALQKGNMMVQVLAEFGWLIHPHKCLGLSRALAQFDSLGYGIDLPQQCFILTVSKNESILDEITTVETLTTIQANHLARIKGLLASTWLALGAHARIRTRSMDKVIQSRLLEGGSPADRNL